MTQPGAEDGARPIALVACTVAVVVWGLGPLFVYELSPDLSTIVFWRMILAQPAMLTMARITEGRLDWRQMTKSSLVPGVLFVGSLLAGFASFRFTSIANATLIQAMTPLLILVVAPRMFGERIRPPLLVTAAVAVGGLVMVVAGAGTTAGASTKGDLLAGVSLVLFAAYFMSAKRQRDRGVSTGTFLAGVFLVAAIVMLPVGAIGSGGLFDLTAKDWLLLCIMVLGPGVVGHGLMTWSQKHLSITAASMLTLASPVVSTIGAWLVQHQQLEPVQVAGIGVVICSLAAVVWMIRPARRPAVTLPVPAEPR